MPCLFPDLLQLRGNFHSKDLLSELRMKRSCFREVGKRLGPWRRGLHIRKPSGSPRGQRAAFPTPRAIHTQGLLNENQSLLCQPKGLPHFKKHYLPHQESISSHRVLGGGYKGGVYSLNPAGGVQRAGGLQEERKKVSRMGRRQWEMWTKPFTS